MALPNEALTGLGRAKVVPDLAELRQALEEIERGEYVELTAEQLEQWADSGIAPWPLE